MSELQPLDAHAHLNYACTEDELVDSGYILAMTLSLEGAASVIGRRDPHIVWGVGCHPRRLKAQKAFDEQRFRDLAKQTALIGEIGLDTGSNYEHASLETQLRIFRKELEIIADLPRIASIHAFRATELVINELRQQPIIAPILHWWTGNVAETREAVELGCYFSVHSAVARHSKFRTAVPRDRILVESDHGFYDPPAAIPCRIEWAEHLVGQQLGLEREEVRRLAWRNLSTIVEKTNTHGLLPKSFLANMEQASKVGQWPSLGKKDVQTKL